MSISHQQAVEHAVAYTKAWCEHNAEAVASLYSGDSEGIIINDGEPWVGRATGVGGPEAGEDVCRVGR